MGILTSWVTNIIMFVLLATVIDMLLPNSAMQKYAKMVIGLLLIAVIITPILNLFHTDFDQLLAETTKNFQEGEGDQLDNLTEIKKKEIQATNDAYILKQTAVQLEGLVEEELMNQYEMKIMSLDLVLKNGNQENPEDDLEKISMVLAQADNDQAVVDVVAKVEINTKQTLPAASTDFEEIKNFLAEQWSVDEQIIEIAGEGGSSKDE